jgi:hypothetical protein
MSSGKFGRALHLQNVKRTERRVRERVDDLTDLLGLQTFRDKSVHVLQGSTGPRPIIRCYGAGANGARAKWKASSSRAAIASSWPGSKCP